MATWKDFYIAHPWVTPAILRQKYPDIKKHDIDNFIRKPNVKEVLNKDKWRLGVEQSKPNIFEILKKAWEYYIINELGFSLHDEKLPSKLFALTSPKPPWAFLSESKYLSKLDGYKKWTEKGFTRISFAICNIFPGKEYCHDSGIIPSLFFQTATTNSELQDIVGMVEHIYLKFYKGINSSSSSEEIENAKRIFIARHDESSFFKQDFLLSHGLSVLHFQIAPQKAIIQQLARKFRLDVGLNDSVNTQNWSAEKFKRENPDENFSVCKYCNRSPVDLHHFLKRSQRPDLVYHPENVVPICTLVHSCISRKRLSEDINNKYAKANKDWNNAPDGKKSACFDRVMREIHELVYAM